eukprot:gnl/TRDRNA2_/TRDRNA2_64471_c0_seq1.p1 gnl/TRDRNA2_/TRDRNA2_64471_c0~~gnl/TRDRNA2_/TRDRNA2_64471_c0_seq1.p1  ORF type:complete len:219 (+),score=46.72 gnl/TRDRNA2_/TRDRNA2_64471_c0_seq1:50-706(+)
MIRQQMQILVPIFLLLSACLARAQVTPSIRRQPSFGLHSSPLRWQRPAHSLLERRGPFIAAQPSFVVAAGKGFGAAKPAAGAKKKKAKAPAPKKPAAADANDPRVFNIQDDICDEASILEGMEAYASAFLAVTGLKKGNCEEQGYTVEVGTKNINAPMMGSVVLTQYKKPEPAAFVEVTSGALSMLVASLLGALAGGAVTVAVVFGSQRRVSSADLCP